MYLNMETISVGAFALERFFREVLEEEKIPENYEFSPVELRRFREKVFEQLQTGNQSELKLKEIEAAMNLIAKRSLELLKKAESQFGSDAVSTLIENGRKRKISQFDEIDCPIERELTLLTTSDVILGLCLEFNLFDP